MRYRAFADQLREAYPMELPDELSLIFYMPMPVSWSKKKCAEMRGKPHQQRPDIDNLTKSVLDALSKNDQTVWRCEAVKVWDDEGGIWIETLRKSW